MIGINLSLWSAALSKGGIAYEPEALALFARFTTPPTAQRKGLINALIKSLKTGGVWAKLDALHLTAAADSQAARQNWIADQYNWVATSGPTFVADRGCTGDGAASYLESGFNPITAISPKFTQNSAHQGSWSLTNLANGGALSYDLGANGNSYIGRNATTSGLATGRPNVAAGQNYAAGSYPGHASWSRTAAGIWEAYAQGVDGGGGTTASAAPTSQTFRACGVAGPNYGVNQLAATHWGAGLTAGEMALLYASIKTYLQALGAA